MSAVSSPPKAQATSPTSAQAGNRLSPVAVHAQKARKPRTGSRRSSILLKAVMAVSGVVMIAFLVLHMIGNLKVLFGREDFNHYSHWLRTIGEPALPHEGFLWIMRVGLLVAVFAHMISATVLTVRAKRARPVAYKAKRKSVQQTYASRTMRWGGVIILAYILYHLLDLTLGVANPAGTGATPYDRFVADFQRWYIVAAYVVPLVLLGMHLRHGLWSAFQTLGLSNARRQRGINLFATGASTLLILGFLVGPAAVVIGVVK
ncbi:succinate dehydrogenase cytochrome b subunit [Bailinhaonella thermotolerans]|uniref:succinate dehydrogenase cytochrome b subunit n=1 Tax=Bailinhaonella thermotolerans TaxID=1070861 RepID=UPI001F5B7BB9|nr:succinate dehydrogenase cytochrome b subunit [Bailinhaonella thermotolerans]